MRKIIYTSIFVLGMYANVYTAPNVEVDAPAVEVNHSDVTVHKATSQAIRLAVENFMKDILIYDNPSHSFHK